MNSRVPSPQDSPPEQPQSRRDFGEPMELDDLLAMAQITEEDVLRAAAWWDKTAKPDAKIGTDDDEL